MIRFDAIEWTIDGNPYPLINLNPLERQLGLLQA